MNCEGVVEVVEVFVFGRGHVGGAFSVSFDFLFASDIICETFTN